MQLLSRPARRAARASNSNACPAFIVCLTHPQTKRELQQVSAHFKAGVSRSAADCAETETQESFCPAVLSSVRREGLANSRSLKEQALVTDNTLRTNGILPCTGWELVISDGERERESAVQILRAHYHKHLKEHTSSSATHTDVLLAQVAGKMVADDDWDVDVTSLLPLNDSPSKATGSAKSQPAAQQSPVRALPVGEPPARSSPTWATPAVLHSQLRQHDAPTVTTELRQSSQLPAASPATHSILPTRQPQPQLSSDSMHAKPNMPFSFTPEATRQASAPSSVF